MTSLSISRKIPRVFFLRGNSLTVWEMQSLGRLVGRYIYPFFRRGQLATVSTNMSSISEDDKHRIVWVDLEMTGLNIDVEHIIEMAVLVTDGKLNVVAEGPNLIIHQSDDVLNAMGDWCKKHHGQSGLTKAVQESKITLEDAESQMLSFVKQHTPAGQCPLAGNSIHADKKFLDKFMPRFMEHLHYRIVDVSTLKELCRRWYPAELKGAPSKKESHRALGDIKESIEELKYYRKTIFRQ